MLAVRLSPDIEKRLDELSKKTGRTKTYYACEAIIEYIDDPPPAELSVGHIKIDYEEALSTDTCTMSPTSSL